MSDELRFAADGVAVAILAFALYFPRYRRRDMVVALLGVNAGVLAVTTVLGRAEVTAGLGLGLFGILSIMRLRSSELDYEEIAYFFAALALAIVGGVDAEPEWLSVALMGLVLAALHVGDHPSLFGSYRHQSMTLDRAFTDERELTEHLEMLLGARVVRVRTKRVNLVDDTTSVDVRFVAPGAARRTTAGRSHEAITS